MSENSAISDDKRRILRYRGQVQSAYDELVRAAREVEPELPFVKELREATYIIAKILADADIELNLKDHG